MTATGRSIADPLFTNAAGGDFTLQAASPCRGAGVNLGATYDDYLDPDSTWPSAITTVDADKVGWNIGAYGNNPPSAGSDTPQKKGSLRMGPRMR